MRVERILVVFPQAPSVCFEVAVGSTVRTSAGLLTAASSPRRIGSATAGSAPSCPQVDTPRSATQNRGSQPNRPSHFARPPLRDFNHPRHHGRSHLPGSSPVTRSTPERHGVSSHFFCRVKKVTALTPGAGKRSTVSAPPGTPTRVLHQSPGLRGPPRYPGCAWQSPNNHNVVVPRQRTRTLPSTCRLANPTPRAGNPSTVAPIRGSPPILNS